MPTRVLILVLTLLLSSPVAAQRRKPRAEAAPKTADSASTPSNDQASPRVPTPPPSALKGLKARSIGPAVMGGRVSDVALDPVDPATFYVGLATGGVVKTSNNGVTFDAIFEKEAVASIGAIAVSPADARVVWVGTGEPNDRNSSGWGNGVYRSVDGGGTWTNVGLRESKAIARIVLKPDDPNTAYVAAVGDLWSPSPERGLYKTTDGGKTWRAVLQAPEAFRSMVGCGEVAIDPSNPDTVFAALYGRRRTPWSFAAGPAYTNGQDVGGIFKSTDGGATWRKLSSGLPGGMGRIGIDIHRKNPKIVYAIVQSDDAGTSDIGDVKSKRGGVFRSDDSGETWRRMNALNPRPFYFSQIRVDPSNDARVYVLGFAVHVSDDAGATFREEYFEKVHPDCHALAIDWRQPKRLILGTDGGPYQSYEGGKNWHHLNNVAAGEYYRIAVDQSEPYRIAGGLQDNVNWVGPSRTYTKNGIANAEWENIEGGDGFYCVFDPDDRDVVYAESQSGFVHRFDLRTGEVKILRPEPAEGQSAFRFHWNSPFIGSRHTKGVMYLGANRVFKLTGRGEEWKLISPDLSTNDPTKTTAVGSGAETFGVIYTIAESPVKVGMLWAGTDDGKLWITEDEGGRWTDLTANLPPSARGQWISRVEAGWSDAQVAYIAVDAHRAGIYAPLAFRTGDGGKTWQNVAGNLPGDHPVKVVREDSRNPNLLFAGTEFGLFASFDRGATWSPFGGLPTVAVDDIVIHPRERDLVVATHGRSLYIVDDIRPLEDLTPEVLAADAYLFAPRPAFGRFLLPGFADWGGKFEFRGENPAIGALINWYVRDFTGDTVKISITNAADQPVANLTAPGTPGLNRIVWDLRLTKDLLTDYGGEGPKFVRSGEYTVTLSFGKTKVKQKLVVKIADGVETR
jgi:photosystem II stability/assembly factor-like uncharacterized protein